MKNIIQTSCSELLVDTSIYDEKEALEKFNKLFEKHNWESSPKLTLEVLKELKDDENSQEIVFYDSKGNRAYLQYGDNGYITTGFRLDSNCNHCDSLCYPLFNTVEKELNGEIIACDGGSTSYYEEWQDKQNKK